VLIGITVVLVPGSNSTVEVDVEAEDVLDDVAIVLEVVEDEVIIVER
jgi:predicted RNA-binding protein with TRAM domain